MVVVDDNRYAVLDHVMGRVFTYNFSGELLYVFGAIGEVVGSFRDPVAIDCIGDHFLVLDLGQGINYGLQTYSLCPGNQRCLGLLSSG